MFSNVPRIKLQSALSASLTQNIFNWFQFYKDDIDYTGIIGADSFGGTIATVEIGGGDDYALFKEKEAAKKEANKELERLTAQYGDQPIPQQEVDDIMRKRNKTVDFADQNIGRINPKTKIRR